MWGSPNGLATVAALLAAIAASARAQSQSRPAITATGSDVEIKARHLTLVDTDRGAAASPPLSVRAMAAELSALQATVLAMQATMANQSAAFVTSEQVTDQIDAAVAGVLVELRSEMIQQTGSLAARVDANERGLVGLPQTVAAVAELASSIEYLRAHSTNVTACAADGEVHAGDGTCIDPVPQCPTPAAPDGGRVSLSATFIIPGVRATYSCQGNRAFVAGPDVRTCIEATLAFSGSVPRCLNCSVANCLRCTDAVDNCAVCGYGHDLSADNTTCVERALTTVIFGGSATRHNYNQGQALDPNANAFRYFLPHPPISLSGGAVAVIAGNTYVFGRGGHGSLSGHFKLPRGASSWESFNILNSFTADFPFFATISGEGAENGFYLFGRNNAGVLQPAVDESRWTRFATIPRNNGATAVVGKLIYCTGGNGLSAASNQVDIFNTTSRTWSEGPAMPTGRRHHSAAAYDNKVYVFGGRDGGSLVLNSVDELNVATGQWTAKAPMPEAWEYMSTGPMPTYANGVIMIPHHKTWPPDGVQTSLQYDTRANTWSTGPPPVLKIGQYAVTMGSFE